MMFGAPHRSTLSLYLIQPSRLDIPPPSSLGYRGYWIKDAPKMAYKSRFRPVAAFGPSSWRILQD